MNCREWLFNGDYTDQELADVFAIIHNQFLCHAHDVVDPDSYIDSYIREMEFEDWKLLYGQAKYRIVYRFLPEHGYYDATGWWRKKDEVKE